MTKSHNKSEYTLTFINAPQLTRGSVGLLEKNANAAIKYLADNISWQGVLDFVVYWDKDRYLGSYWRDGGPGFGAYGDSSSGVLAGLEEAITGIDSNGGDFDAGTWVGPDNNSIADYGEDIYIDPDPNPLDDDIASRDFLSIFLHEVLHSLGMWSNLQHQENAPWIIPTKFDSLTKKVNDQWFFIGEKTKEIHGGPLPLALTGSRDHYSHSLEFDIDLMREYGLAEKWQISDIDLAILFDLGHDVIKWRSDPEHESYKLPRTNKNIYGNKKDNNLKGTKKPDFIDGKKGNDTLSGGKGDDVLKGSHGQDVLIGARGQDYLNGSKGNDILNGGQAADVFQISKGLDIIEDFNITQGDRIALDKTETYTIIDDPEGVRIMATATKQLLLSGADYDEIMNADADLFVRVV